MGVLDEFIGQLGGRVDRVNEHLQGDILLEWHGEHEIDEFFGQVAVGRAFQDTDKLDLTETAIEDGGGGGFGERLGCENDLGGGAGCVGDDHRLGALPGGCAKVGVIGGFPSIDNNHAVGFEGFPILKVAGVAVAGDGGEQEGQAGRGGGGIFDDEQALVFGFEQVIERCRGRQVFPGEPGFIVIDAHVAKIDGQGAVLGIEFESGGDFSKKRGIVRLENACFEGAGEEGVIDAKKYIGQGGFFGKNGFVEGRTGIAGFKEGQFDVVFLLEVGNDFLAGREGVVGHDGQGAQGCR